MNDTVFSITQRDLLGIILLLAFMIIPIGISLMPYKGNPDKPPLFEVLQLRLGLAEINSGVLFIAATLWVLIFASLAFGLLAVIWSFAMAPFPQGNEAVWDWRFSLAKLAALTATLGAVVVLPLTVIRLTLSRTQTETAVEALFNDKINAAVEDLHTQRQISKPIADSNPKTHETIWQDDVIRRNGAIDRLEGLVQENHASAERVARMLSVYVRELSREIKALIPPNDSNLDALVKWERELSPARSDMQNAVQVLGRLQQISGVKTLSGLINLSGANLQGFGIHGLDIRSAILHSAQLQGAVLAETQLQKANLICAQLQGALLLRTQMQGADLSGADLQGAHLFGARLQQTNLFGAKLHGADLRQAEFDAETSFSYAILRGAALKDVDLTDVAIKPDQLTTMYGDATVTLPGGHGPHAESWPTHWSRENLSRPLFLTQWRAFQRSIGQDSDSPT